MDLRNDNPLQTPILRYLRDQPGSVTEHALIRHLESLEVFPPLASEPSLALFQRHFLVMNALYRLRDRLWLEESRVLEISPLHIVLGEPRPAAAGTGALPEVDTGLRDYYLDPGQLVSTTATEVDSLLAGFWQRLLDPGATQRALEALGLPHDASAGAIRHRYRQLAARHHPDRGGDRAAFLSVREAYEVLRGAGAC